MAEASTIPRPFRLQPLLFLAAALALLGVVVGITAGRGMSDVWRLTGVSLPLVAAWWVAAAGFGWPLCRWMLHDAPHQWGPRSHHAASGAHFIVQLGVGMAGLLLLDWLLAWAGWLNGWTAWLLCGLGTILGIVQATSALMRGRFRIVEGHVSWAWLLLMPGIGVLVAACCCPPGVLWTVEAFGYDAISYHLQLPREWMAAGRMHGLEHNVFSYLPNLVEAGYLHLGLMRGSMRQVVYSTQFFHAGMAVLAVTALSCLIQQWASRLAGQTAAVILLVVPWMIITGSLAYNEMAVLALGATALLLLFSPAGATLRGVVLIGFLAGSATLAKLTAGPMLALPLALIVLLRWHHATPQSWRRGLGDAAALLLVVLLVLSPYLLRNHLWTGNPVFPLAADHLGRAHWQTEQVQRWNQAHAPTGTVGDRMVTLADRWLLNRGYGAIATHAVHAGGRDITAFPVRGVPLVWLTAGLGAVLGCTVRPWRSAVWACGLMLFVQLAVWLAATHQQSRFLLVTLLPAGVFIGLAFEWLRRRLGRHGTVVMMLVAVLLAAKLWVINLALIQQQALPGFTLQEVIGMELAAYHPINNLPRDAKVYLVADNTRLFYFDRAFSYHSAFDASPLGDWIRRNHADPRAVTQALRQSGHTHVWINFDELERLHETYGHDPQVTAQSLNQLAQAGGWRKLIQSDPFVLYQLP